jgi:hypothetical protein
MATTVLVKTTNPYIVNYSKETAVHASTYGGVRGRQRLNIFAPYFNLYENRDK